MSGIHFNLNDNDAILKINSPKNRVGGPYLVVQKSIAERWAIVAMEWDKKPALAIRWFHGNRGNPLSFSHPTWVVIPFVLCKGILLSLSLDTELRDKIDDFLNQKLSGNDLKNENSG